MSRTTKGGAPGGLPKRRSLAEPGSSPRPSLAGAEALRLKANVNVTSDDGCPDLGPNMERGERLATYREFWLGTLEALRDHLERRD